ncbi:unnamed protein product [Paramecium primaurelia]|uniref:Transmembrane protein n=1 Tax=Paramecium primaurelia TaxID=5886 RepID=A0A8S1NL49_PARPR|nr:unnamed protein product [Paramecium primaurelia]
MQQNPIQFQIITCNLTSSPEKFICISTQCQENRDQSFGCYECLIKRHNQIDQLHFDKIIEITTFLSQIQQKQQKKIELLEKVIKEQNSKKKVVQQKIIEDQNILNNDLVQQRIEQLFNIDLMKLQNEKDSINNTITYSNQQQCKLLKLFNEDIEQYEKEITEKELKLQGNVDQILESCQIVTLQQFNILKNQIQKLQDEYQKQLLLINQLKTQQITNKRNTFIEVLLWFYVPLLFLIFLYLNKEYPHLFYSTSYDLESESDLKQIIEKIQDQKSVSKNQTNQSWLISEILENRSVQEFQNFTLLYENSFSEPFTNYSYEQILLKVFQDKKDQIVCIGAKLNLNLKLIGCDLASEIFSLTQNAYSARKSKNGEIYWYWFSSKSFGFSPNRDIALNNTDEEDPSCELRFSYGTTKNLEDRRIGSLKGYQNTKEYNLVIYMLNENN